MMKDSKVSIGIELRYRPRFKIVLATIKVLCVLKMERAALTLYDYAANDIQNNVDKYVIAVKRD